METTTVFADRGHHHEKPDLPIVIRALMYSGVPAVAMALGSVSVCFAKPRAAIQASFQRFSSGLLMGVAIIDIFPLLRSRLYPYGTLDFWNSIALYVGFISAVALMYILRCLECKEHVEAESDMSGSSGEDVSRVSDKSTRFSRWSTKDLEDVVFADQQKQENMMQPTQSAARIPWGQCLVSLTVDSTDGLVVAVVIDCCVDGMLIGLTTSGGTTSGLMLALAAAIESAFLGFSFTVALLRATRRRCAAVIAALPCLMMVTSAVTAGVWAEGMLSFSLIALLFMILEELLVEARATRFGGLWAIGIWFYIGFLMSITFDIFL